MPWAPGQSGNRRGGTGRKAGPVSLELKKVRQLARDNATKAIDVLVQMMTSADKDSDKHRAAREVLLWAFGRPDMLVMVEGADVGLDEAGAHERVAILKAALSKAEREAEQAGALQ